MIGQIGHLVQVSPRVGLISAGLYTLGATLSAGLIGLVVGSAGWVVRWLFALGPAGNAILVPLGVLSLVCGLRDLGILRLPIPQPRTQVPRYWLAAYGPYKAGLYWGFSIGLIFTTWIEYTLLYVVGLWIFLAGSPWVGMLALALFGMAQGVLLTLEVAVIAARGHQGAGLLGPGRCAFFSEFGGVILLACGAFFFARLV